jgi:hypothetical protein
MAPTDPSPAEVAVLCSCSSSCYCFCCCVLIGLACPLLTAHCCYCCPPSKATAAYWQPAKHDGGAVEKYDPAMLEDWHVASAATAARWCCSAAPACVNYRWRDTPKLAYRSCCHLRCRASPSVAPVSPRPPNTGSTSAERGGIACVESVRRSIVLHATATFLHSTLLKALQDLAGTSSVPQRARHSPVCNSRCSYMSWSNTVS